uniref:Uncharacterized protein LOC114337276 n=1 Tax=Diabrotica virgifera virgifera TaxID=50390 RepID=A0A6P7G3I8_DIAVI
MSHRKLLVDMVISQHEDSAVLVNIEETKTRKNPLIVKKYVQPWMKGKINTKKKQISPTGFIEPNGSGKRQPHNARPDEKAEAIKHIESFPKYESHYSRRHTSRLYLAPNLNIKLIYDLYVSNRTMPVSYLFYAKIFKELEYKFKNLSIDTCKTCDYLENKKKSSNSEEIRAAVDEGKNKHLQLTEIAYGEKKADIEFSRNSSGKMVVLVFDLQQNLPTPNLSTNVVYYKRLLWTYNLTIRNCTENTTSCFMWHEGLSDRGSDQVASCLLKYLDSLVNTVEKVALYSDSCPGQNKNNIVAGALSLFVYRSTTINEIQHKFLEVGHTRMECDADHARIERAKKSSQKIVTGYLMTGTSLLELSPVRRNSR